MVSKNRILTFFSTIVAAIGELDLTLYTGYDSDDSSIYPQNHLGRLWYTLFYNSVQEQLHVTVAKAKHLPSDINADTPKDCSVKYANYENFFTPKCSVLINWSILRKFYRVWLWFLQMKAYTTWHVLILFYLVTILDKPFAEIWPISDSLSTQSSCCFLLGCVWCLMKNDFLRLKSNMRRQIQYLTRALCFQWVFFLERPIPTVFCCAASKNASSQLWNYQAGQTFLCMPSVQ